jgi:hypothetical protein
MFKQCMNFLFFINIIASPQHSGQITNITETISAEL